MVDHEDGWMKNTSDESSSKTMLRIRLSESLNLIAAWECFSLHKILCNFFMVNLKIVNTPE